MTAPFIFKLPKPGRFGRRLASVIAATFVAMWSIFAGIAYDSYRSTWYRTELLASDVATMLAYNVTDAIEASDLALQLAATRLRAGSYRPQAANPATDQPPMRDRKPLLLLDERGRVVFDSSGARNVGDDLSGRDDFRAQRDESSVRPSRARIGGRGATPQALSISRALRGANGRFEGLAIGSIPLDRLRRCIAAIRLPLGSTVALTDSTGPLLTLGHTGADAAATTGTDVSSSVHAARGFDVTHIIPGASMSLALTIPTGQIMRHWRSRIEMLALGFLTVTTAICFLGFTAAIELDRRGQAEHRLAELASTDGLTHVANRRRFDEVFDLEWRRAIREETSISLLMIDGDFFKAFNDGYGHAAGDEALRKLADALRLCASRAGDLVARVGGEEFAALLPSTDAAGAAGIAQAIRHSILALTIPHKGSPHGVLTVSIGVATRKPSRQSKADLAAGADAALYLAKSGGRDCIVIEEPGGLRGAPQVA